jgi:hypothetical protein
MEVWHFHEPFGVDIAIMRMVWAMLKENGLCLKRIQPKHLLWTLYFMKVYPKQSLGCSTFGNSTGTVDPKTMTKWVWNFWSALLSFWMMC